MDRAALINSLANEYEKDKVVEVKLDRGNYIEIERGNLVRVGNDIEIYDYSTGTYKDVEVQSISNGEIEVYDYDTDEYRTFDMD